MEQARSHVGEMVWTPTGGNLWMLEFDLLGTEALIEQVSRMPYVGRISEQGVEAGKPRRFYVEVLLPETIDAKVWFDMFLGTFRRRLGEFVAKRIDKVWVRPR